MISIGREKDLKIQQYAELKNDDIFSRCTLLIIGRLQLDHLKLTKSL